MARAGFVFVLTTLSRSQLSTPRDLEGCEVVVIIEVKLCVTSHTSHVTRHLQISLSPSSSASSGMLDRSREYLQSTPRDA